MESHNINFVITIGRQYGSGGREIGRLVADALNVKYYDKELLTEAAKASGVKPEIVVAIYLLFVPDAVCKAFSRRHE